MPPQESSSALGTCLGSVGSLTHIESRAPVANSPGLVERVPSLRTERAGYLAGYLATSLLSQALLWAPSLHHLISAPSTHVEWAGPGLLAKCSGKGHVIGGGKAWVPARATPPLRAVSCLGHRRVMSDRPRGHSSGLNSPSKNFEVGRMGSSLFDR